jgi:N-methylhydantoinase A/oxoprolinase/acetone carboxylase beta subunit
LFPGEGEALAAYVQQNLRIPRRGEIGYNAEDIAYGFLQVANEAMCRPIRNLTQMKGFDITTHKLARLCNGESSRNVESVCA